LPGHLAPVWACLAPDLATGSHCCAARGARVLSSRLADSSRPSSVLPSALRDRTGLSLFVAFSFWCCQRSFLPHESSGLASSFLHQSIFLLRGSLAAIRRPVFCIDPFFCPPSAPSSQQGFSFLFFVSCVESRQLVVSCLPDFWSASVQAPGHQFHIGAPAGSGVKP
jgi:hypothetical protein